MIEPFNNSGWCFGLTVALLSWGCVGPTHAAQGPTEDSLWYYEIGGAEPVSAPANPSVVSVTLGGALELGLGYSCGKFDPLAAVSHTLDQIATGAEQMMNAMTHAATAAIAALPALKAMLFPLLGSRSEARSSR